MNVGQMANESGNSKIQQILRTSGKNTEVLRISDLMTNASQEQRFNSNTQVINNSGLGETNTTNVTKRSNTDQLAQHASGCSNVTTSDIRQIKLNYLQLNKRSTY